jgi:hypothetical protein
VEPADRIDQAVRLLEERGRDVGPVRFAAGRSGVAVGFPRDPLIHVSWLAATAVTGVVVAIKLLGSRATRRRPRMRG